MIDIHCHIIPGVDDGPKTLEESLEMARMAEAEGITKIIATPHHQHPSFDNEGPGIVRKVEELNVALQEANIDITVFPAQEVRIHGEIIRNLELGDTLPLGVGSNYILVELPTNSVPTYTTRLFYDLQMKGYTPIIAHPERNKAMIEDPNILYELVKTGVLTQVTSSSVTGHLGKNIKKFSEQLLEANLTHFIASDAHNTTERPFRLQEAYAVVEKQFGMNEVYRLKENAGNLLNNEFIQVLQPEPVKKKRRLFGLLK